MRNKPAADRMLDGSSWNEFLDTLRQAGEIILRDGSPRNPFDRAEGFCYLSGLVRVALESRVEFADAQFPVLRRPAHETVKIGADNPDNYYQRARRSAAPTGTASAVAETAFTTWASAPIPAAMARPATWAKVAIWKERI